MVVAVARARARARRGGRTATAGGRRGGSARARATRRGGRGRRRRSRALAICSSPRSSSTVTPAAGRAGGRVEHVGRERDAHPENFRACDAMGLRDLGLVGVARARRRGRPPRRRRRAGRRGAGRRRRCPPRDRRRRRARGRRCARRRSRRTCPARASRCRRAAAPPRRRGCRAGSRRAPSSPRRRPRPRATSSACFTSRNRSPRSFDAEPSTPRPTRTPASSMSRTGATPAPSRRFDVGQWATPVPVLANCAMSALGEVDAVGAPDVVGEPAEPVEVLDRPAAVELEAVRLLLERLREVGVQRQPEPARERGRLLHQAAGDRERRARRDRQLDARARAGLVQQRRRGARSRRARRRAPRRARPGGRPPSETPRSIEPREATIRTPISRAACTSASIRPSRPSREDVVVVEHRRAARERELGEAGARGGVLRLGVDPRPDRVELAQPGEEVGLLRPGARERLVEVVVRVDEARRDDGAARGRPRRPPPARRRRRRPTIVEPSTSSQPLSCSVPASSIVTIQPFA